jgi:hypothetical protein
LAGLFFTTLLVEAFFVVATLGFRAILFFALAPVLLLPGLLFFFAAVLFFLDADVIFGFILFAFTAAEPRPLEVFLALVLAVDFVFPPGLELRVDFRPALLPGVVLPETLFLRAVDAVVLPVVFFAELPPLVFLPAEVLFLGIGLFLLTQIHSISVFLFIW